MGIFSLFNRNSSGFEPFLKKQLITPEQYEKLTTFKAQGKPHSKILNDYTPECLLAYIVAKTQALYNNTYFKRSYLELAGRQPYWVAEAMDKQTEEKIRNDHKTLLHCLQQSGLISPFTYEKIAQQTENGIIYKPWEMINIARALTEYEEDLKKVNIEAELRPLLKNGILSPADSHTVIAEIQKGHINEKSEVIRRFGKKAVVPARIAGSGIEKYIEALLDTSLELLPFYRSHRVRSIGYYDMIDPYHKNYTLKHTSVTLEFNQKEYVFPVNMSNNFYRIAPGFSIGLFSGILAHLCKEYGDQYEVVTLKDYFLGQRSAENADIQSYYLLLLRKGYEHSFFLKEKMASSVFSTVPVTEKQDFLVSLFALFDEGRFSEADREFTYKNVIHSDIPDTTSIPHFVPGLTCIVWYDILSDVYQYRDIIADLASISNGRFQPENVTDGFAAVNDGETFEVSLQVHSSTYSTRLTKGTVDYDLFRLLEKIQAENNLGGKFYIFNDSFIYEGYIVIFLSDDEMERLKNNPLFKADDLKSAVNVWLNK